VPDRPGYIRPLRTSPEAFPAGSFNFRSGPPKGTIRESRWVPLMHALGRSHADSDLYFRLNH